MDPDEALKFLQEQFHIGGQGVWEAEAIVFGDGRSIARSTLLPIQQANSHNFYTAEAVWFLNISRSVSHAQYLKECKSLSRSQVTFSDRKPVLDHFQETSRVPLTKPKPQEPVVAQAEATPSQAFGLEKPNRSRNNTLQGDYPKDFKNVLQTLDKIRKAEADARASTHDGNYNRYQISESDFWERKYGDHSRGVSGLDLDTGGSVLAKKKDEPLKRPAAKAAPAPAPAPKKARAPKIPSPIIIVPSALSSPINMFNVRYLLEDHEYIPVQTIRARGEAKKPIVRIKRKRTDGRSIEYTVMDSIQSLTDSDWKRVVAVFVIGQDWQFKDWPWKGNPVNIFDHVAAFHLTQDELNLDKTIKNWNVRLLKVSKTKRHLDRPAVLKFWEQLDSFVASSRRLQHYSSLL